MESRLDSYPCCHILFIYEIRSEITALRTISPFYKRQPAIQSNIQPAYSILFFFKGPHSRLKVPTNTILLQHLVYTKGICERMWLTSLTLASRRGIYPLTFPDCTSSSNKDWVYIFPPHPPFKTSNFLLLPIMLSGTAFKPEAWQSFILVPSSPFLSIIFYLSHYLHTCLSLNLSTSTLYPLSTTIDVWVIFKR